MLAHEWRELEELCERIGALRQRIDAARRTGNTGLLEGLTAEMERAARQRESLVRHISTQLGSAAIARPPASGPAAHPESPAAGHNPALLPAKD